MSNDKDILKGRRINHPNFNKNSVDKKGKEKKKVSKHSSKVDIIKFPQYVFWVLIHFTFYCVR